MKKFFKNFLGLALSVMVLASCSQMATYEQADVTPEAVAAAKNGFNLTPFGSGGENVRVLCGPAEVKNARRLQGSAAILATDYGDISISNDETNLYIDIDADAALTPTFYSFFLGSQASIVNLGGLNGVIATNGSSTATSFTVPIAGILDVYPALVGVNFDLGVVFETVSGGTTTRYWAEGTKFSNVNSNQGAYFTYTLQTDCPEEECYGKAEGSWSDGVEYLTSKNFSTYSSKASLIAGVDLNAGAKANKVGRVTLIEEDGKASITIQLLEGFVFGDGINDEDGNLEPGSVFIQPFSQADVDSKTIDGFNGNNPAQGKFKFKFNDVDGSSFTATDIDINDFYGIKTSVQAIIDCPVQ